MKTKTLKTLRKFRKMNFQYECIRQRFELFKTKNSKELKHLLNYNYQL